MSKLRILNAQLQGETDLARAAASAAVSRQRTLEESLALIEAEAAERSRKFALIQRSFRTGESEMQVQLDSLTEELQVARQQQAKAELQGRQAIEQAEVASSNQRMLQQQLDSTKLTLSRLEAEMSEQVSARW